MTPELAREIARLFEVEASYAEREADEDRLSDIGEGWEGRAAALDARDSAREFRAVAALEAAL